MPERIRIRISLSSNAAPNAGIDKNGEGAVESTRMTGFLWLAGAVAICFGLILVARAVTGLVRSVRSNTEAIIVVAKNLGDTDVGRIIREVAGKPGNTVFRL
jgi:hypothetical protein